MTPTVAPPQLPTLKAQTLTGLAETRRFFDRTTRVLEEKDSSFRATPETMTVTEHVAHVAQTIDWFREGCLADKWSMDFEAMRAETARVTSLTEARRWLAEAWERLREAIAATPDARLAEAIAENPILGPRPRAALVQALVDHSAHHRGALAVYARLLGRVPPMVYGED